MEKLKLYKKQIKFHLILNLVFGIFITFSTYYNLPLKYFSDYLIYFIHFLMLQFTVFGFLYILSINKYIFYATFPPLFIFYSLFSYWVYTQDITVSGSIIQAAIETKMNIAIDLISLPLLLYFFLIIGVLIFIIKLYNKLHINQLKSPLILFSIIGILTFFIVENYKFGVFKRRLPYSLTFAIINYSNKPELKISSISNKIKHRQTSINIIFVLGESVRADHLRLNNYSRNTTPLLNEIKNVISLPNVYTPFTYTAISVPQILTNTSITQIKTSPIYSLYSILNNSNFKTYWIGNQTPEKSYYSFINENNYVELIDKFHSVLSFHKKLDNELIPPFKKIFNKTTNQFITLHMIGSHWWYENRYSKNFRKYKPVINSKYIPSLTKNEIINSYDNTILYLDNFLHSIISILKKEHTETILIYLSDHGEILGENGKWLHAQNDGSSTNPAMIVWYSDEFKKAHPDKVRNLKNNADKKITTDFFFNSILDLIEVENFNYVKSKSIFYNKNNYVNEEN